MIALVVIYLGLILVCAIEVIRDEWKTGGRS